MPRPAAAMPDAELTLSALVAWGEALGARLEAPGIVSLAGDLGAGKTTLVQAICRGYGVRDAVTSPTFSLVHQYYAPRSPVYHLDLFRLAGPQDLANIGWEDALTSGALVLIEWPDRAGAELPANAKALRLAYVAGAPSIRRLWW